MKTQEILQKATGLRKVGATLLPREVLDLLIELAEVVENLKGTLLIGRRLTN